MHSVNGFTTFKLFEQPAFHCAQKWIAICCNWLLWTVNWQYFIAVFDAVCEKIHWNYERAFLWNSVRLQLFASIHQRFTSLPRSMLPPKYFCLSHNGDDACIIRSSSVVTFPWNKSENRNNKNILWNRLGCFACAFRRQRQQSGTLSSFACTRVILISICRNSHYSRLLMMDELFTVQ